MFITISLLALYFIIFLGLNYVFEFISMHERFMASCVCYDHLKGTLRDLNGWERSTLESRTIHVYIEFYLFRCSDRKWSRSPHI